MELMNQSKLKNIKDDQFSYLGRWVNKTGFRAFVYGEKDKEKLANSYDEFMGLISSGLWFESKDAIPKDNEIPQMDKRKPKNASLSNSK